MTKEKILKKFEKEYFDKNTPTGLNQKPPFFSFVRMMNDIKDNFLPKSLDQTYTSGIEDCFDAVLNWINETHKSHYGY